MTEIHFSRNVPLRHDVDVFVAGGGPAGVAAAIAAARQGASVFLAEGQGCFGGMGTAGLVPAFMQFGDGVNFLAGGIGREVYERLFAAGGVGPDDQQDVGACCAGIRAEVLKRVYDEMMGESGAGFAFGTQMIAADAAKGAVSHVVCSGKSGLFAVKARVFVDASGDGDLAAWAGAPFEKGDADGKLMPGTLCSLYADIDWEAVRASGHGHYQFIEQAIANGVFTNPDRHLPGFWRVGRHVGGGNIGHTFGVDGTDERSLTKALLWGRQYQAEYQRFYKEYLTGYEGMELVATGALLGIRETRRITGDYTMTLADFLQRASFPDEIGRYSYPVDIHASNTDAGSFEKFMNEHTNLRYGEGENYGIPYRALTPRGLINVLVAGRCISTDRYMQSSVRVMPGCYITGQAAGVAAALAADDVHAVDVAEVQRRLVALGGYLPNCG
jgi:hypothetical protein